MENSVTIIDSQLGYAWECGMKRDFALLTADTVMQLSEANETAKIMESVYREQYGDDEFFKFVAKCVAYKKNIGLMPEGEEKNIVRESRECRDEFRKKWFEKIFNRSKAGGVND